MQKRAGLARAMALDPEILMLDEPSAGLDPITARLLDDLILEIRDNLARPSLSSHMSLRVFSGSPTTAYFSTPKAQR